MMSLETWIGLRYLRAKKRSGFMSFISVMSVLGIALGVIVLIVVLSVVNGFQKEIRGQMLNIAPHARAQYMDPPPDAGWRDLQKLLDANPAVSGSAPLILGQALTAASGEVRGAQLSGILPEEEDKVSVYGKSMVSGSLDSLKADGFNIILGEQLAADLGAEVGGKVTVITPEGNVTPAGVVPRLKQFTVSGLVRTGVEDADAATALIHLADAQKLYRYTDADTPLRLRLADPQNAPALMDSLLPPDMRDRVMLENWTDRHRSYFNAVEMEKRLLTILLAGIILVAVFNLVSSLMMAVNEKQADIAILRTLGLPPAGVMKIFVVQGMVAGVIGTFAGTVLGLLLAWKIGPLIHWLEGLSGRQLVSAKVYFISYLPSDIHASDVIGVVSISLLLSLLATLYPSRRAARTQPAEALRYE